MKDNVEEYKEEKETKRIKERIFYINFWGGKGYNFFWEGPQKMGPFVFFFIKLVWEIKMLICLKLVA
jgi:hypothetical protein